MVDRPLARQVETPGERFEHLGSRAPPFPVRRQAVGTVAFCEAFAVRPENQRDMKGLEGRRPVVQECAQQKLAPGGGPQVVAPHDTGDALREVVDRHGELVRPQPVRTPEHKVSDAPVNIFLERSEPAVDVAHDVARLGSKADRGGAVWGRIRPGTTRSGVSRGFVGGSVGGRGGENLAAGARAVKNAAPGGKPVEHRLVELGAPTLAVRALRPFRVG